MSHELIACGLCWLAHLAWYGARARDGRIIVAIAVSFPRVARGVAGALWVTGCGLLVAQHGWALGLCCALAAATAAGSYHVIVGPLSPRATRVAGLLAAVAIIVGAIGGR